MKYTSIHHNDSVIHFIQLEDDEEVENIQNAGEWRLFLVQNDSTDPSNMKFGGWKTQRARERKRVICITLWKLSLAIFTTDSLLTAPVARHSLS